jgi:hypothetical protein
MGITLDDLNAQRAMLKRGEEKRKAAKQAEERERLRDEFAAAALTGYNANPAWDDTDAVIVAEQCYADADAMLRVRNGAVESRETVRLTAEEREAIEAAIIGGCEMAGTLRKLLERLT